MLDYNEEVKKARRQFILTAGAVFCFLFLPLFFLPLIWIIKNGSLQILISQLLTHGSTILFIVLYSRKCEPEKPLAEVLNLQKTPAYSPMKVLLFFGVLFVVIIAATSLTQGVSHLLGIDLPEQTSTKLALGSSWWGFGVIAFSALILAPLSEELLFRGVLFNAIQRPLGKHGAMIGVSLLFALLHWNALSFLSLFLMGIILQKAAELTGTLRTGIWMHLLNNLVTVIYLLVLRLNGGTL